MNDYFQLAENKLKKARDEINRIIGPPEDVSYYNHLALDGILDLIIEAKVSMAIGRRPHDRS